MTTLTASQARQQLPEAINQVAYGGERVAIKRRGKVVAALVSEEDLALLEALEDQLDIAQARKALSEAKRKSESPIPWEIARKRLSE